MYLRCFVFAEHVGYNAGRDASSFLDQGTTSCLEATLPNVTVDLMIAEFIPSWGSYYLWLERCDICKWLLDCISEACACCVDLRAMIVNECHVQE